MIAGIGTDITEVARIEDKLSRSEHFMAHVFSSQEVEYCEKQKNPAIHHSICKKKGAEGLNSFFEHLVTRGFSG